MAYCVTGKPNRKSHPDGDILKKLLDFKDRERTLPIRRQKQVTYKGEKKSGWPYISPE